MNIRELGMEGAFDPETVQVMSAAFERAWASLQSSGAPFSANDYANRAREILGKQIIRAAKAGSRDERQLVLLRHNFHSVRLADGALIELTQSKPRRSGRA
jgi:hypothetical protein